MIQYFVIYSESDKDYDFKDDRTQQEGSGESGAAEQRYRVGELRGVFFRPKKR